MTNYPPNLIVEEMCVAANGPLKSISELPQV